MKSLAVMMSHNQTQKDKTPRMRFNWKQQAVSGQGLHQREN